MNDDLAIEVKSVYKNFLLPHEKHKSIKSTFTSLFRSRLNSKKEIQHALRDISFDVKKGEFFGIVGRNGSGKSTMLKMLAGIYQPTKGQVSVRGKLVPFIELGVGFNPELTGRENVYLNGALLGFSKSEIDQRYDRIVDFAELEKFMDQKLKNYSSGMQVRLAFSVAIIADADILLVDEVLAVGDASFQRKCFEYFHLLKKNKKTVIFVTHDMGAVREYCDRAILIDQSKLVKKGKPSDIAESYTRLFNEEAEAAISEDKSATRWGNKKAIVDWVKVADKKLTPEQKTIIVEMQVTANQDIENPVVGFSIKDSADNRLFGTNTFIKGKKLGLLKQGESFKITWQAPNILADGRHYVDATIEEADKITVCDWWVEAAQFNSFNPEKTAYHITPSISVKITGDK
ncbi:MAG TPA: ABC transporter ATP-binding protein [Candidatus Saccharimonadales bacterium]|nr:ABC transporter ATP-binding protein [Candidatus Saccharimonadales bacterium]